MEIDRSPMQVAIEATVAEVTLNDNMSGGVQYMLRNFATGSAALVTGAGTATTAGTVISRTLPGASILLGAETDPKVIIEALREKTNVNIISSPSLVVLNNQPAVLQVGDEVPVTTSSATVLSTNNTVVNNVVFKNTGVILKILPRINENGMIVLDIEQEISQIVQNANSTTLTPTISQRRVRSSIGVVSGQSVLLAGLISERRERDKSGVPLLSDISTIGDLFAKKTATSANAPKSSSSSVRRLSGTAPIIGRSPRNCGRACCRCNAAPRPTSRRGAVIAHAPIAQRGLRPPPLLRTADIVFVLAMIAASGAAGLLLLPPAKAAAGIMLAALVWPIALVDSRRYIIPDGLVVAVAGTWLRFRGRQRRFRRADRCGASGSVLRRHFPAVARGVSAIAATRRARARRRQAGRGCGTLAVLRCLRIHGAAGIARQSRRDSVAGMAARPALGGDNARAAGFVSSRRDLGSLVGGRASTVIALSGRCRKAGWTCYGN